MARIGRIITSEDNGGALALCLRFSLFPFEITSPEETGCPGMLFYVMLTPGETG